MRSIPAPSSALWPVKKNRAEPAGELAAATAESLLAGYEDLRRVAVGPPLRGLAAQGLSLLRRSGLAAWVEAFLPMPSPPTAPVSLAAPTPGRLPMDVRGELTLLVAAMALSAVPRGGGVRT